jgi:hypothetical protein
MVWQTTALELAGLIGAGVAVMHGILVQRLMVQPFAALASQDRRFTGTVRRLIPPLLHFSTAVWLIGGLALLATPLLAPDARLAICALVGGAYLIGVVFNFWATRGRHPGWMLLAASLALIVIGATE